MFGEIEAVSLPVAVASVVVGLGFIGCLGYLDAKRRSASRAQLPQGADAALWSITEVLPDPRNHLSIKDPTSELRLTDEERRLALESAASARARAERSADRPAQRAAAEQSLTARKLALAKHEALAGEKRRRALADRDPSAFSSPDVVDRLEELKLEALQLETELETVSLDRREVVEPALVVGAAAPTIDLRVATPADDDHHQLHKRAAS